MEMEKISPGDLWQPNQIWWWFALPLYLVLGVVTIPATIIWFAIDAVFF